MSRHVQRANVSKSTRFLGGNAHHALPRRELDFASGSGHGEQDDRHLRRARGTCRRGRHPDPEDEDTHAIHALNTKGTGDERITLCLLPVANGVTLARRR
jgi:hypothetical protein